MTLVSPLLDPAEPHAPRAMPTIRSARRHTALNSSSRLTTARCPVRPLRLRFDYGRGTASTKRSTTSSSTTAATNSTSASCSFSLVGFLPADDHRVVTTVDAITETLTENGLVLRYRTDGMSTGGLDGAEGTFLVCTFWLVQALAQHGDDERAGAVFERALAVSNDVGLLAEEYDVKHERMVSNFPQACAGWLSR